MIRGSDRVATVLARDERLIDVFAAASPAFERLRHPAMRKVMTRLVTVSSAARMAGVDEQVLIDRLNQTLAGEDASVVRDETEEPSRPGANQDDGMAGAPPFLGRVLPERIVDLDVREDLRQGQEPFSRIMAARGALPDGHVLRLRAIFEPVPLYHVFGRQGFGHWTERLADDDWRVWFYRDDDEVDAAGDEPEEQAAGEAEGSAALSDEPGADDDGVVVLDVRGLDPPEPMVRTLAALESLPEGSTLVQVNVRVPQFLLPRLDEMGFSYEVREQGEVVRLFIRAKPTG